MTNEQIQQWAREAGINPFDALSENVQAFATLVRNATLEEAAVMFDGMDTGGTGFLESEPAEILRRIK
jgi:hypothetical protein